MEERPMTDKEVAKYLQLSPNKGHLTVRRWAREGKLKGGKAGDLWRFFKADVDDMLFLKTR